MVALKHRNLRGLLKATVLAELDRWMQDRAPQTPRPDRHAPLRDWAAGYLPHYYRLPSCDMHRWMQDRCDESVNQRGARVNIIGPRGHAKSTNITLAHVLREAVEGREPLIWLVSETADQAAELLKHVASELTDNQRLKTDYPEATGEGPIWRRDTIQLRNGVEIKALSKGMRIRGRRNRANRPTLIICDDLQGDAAMTSAEGRSKDWRWFAGALLKAGGKRTNIFSVCNALHREAIGSRLETAVGWTSKTFQALLAWPLRAELWSAWAECFQHPDSEQQAEAFYDLHQSELNAGAEVLWPDEWPLLRLMAEREIDRNAFEREMQCRPRSPDSAEWPEEYFTGDDLWFDEWGSDWALRVIALDPSKGRHERRGDFSAFVLLQLGRDACWYVDAMVARVPAEELAARSVQLNREFLPDGFAFEANQFQELLGGEIRNLSGGHPIPLYGVTNTVAKIVRIRKLGPLLQQRKFRFRRGSPGVQLLLQQLRDFPDPHAHDDAPDALEMALSLAGRLLRGEDEDHD